MDKDGAHCFVHNFTRNKKTLKPLFFCSDMALLISNTTQILYRKKNKTLVVHIDVFGA